MSSRSALFVLFFLVLMAEFKQFSVVSGKSNMKTHLLIGIALIFFATIEKSSPVKEGKETSGLLPDEVFGKLLNMGLKLISAVFVSENVAINSTIWFVLMKEVFNTTAHTMDFSKPQNALQQIESVIQKKSNFSVMNIFELEKSVTPETAAIFTNVIYFKWPEQFQLERNKIFYLDNWTHVPVPVMTKKNEFNIGRVQNMDAQFIELLNENEEFSLIIMLPNAFGLKKLENNIKKIDLPNMLKAGEKTRATLQIPKFRVENYFDVTNVMNEMDMSAFTTDQIKLDKALDKFIFEVDLLDSDGFENEVSREPEYSTKYFKVNRPFYYIVLHHPTQTIAFSGSVYSPMEHGN